MVGARRQLELEGIVLQLRNFGDAHRIVEVVTREEGRIALLARGARASRRRFAGVLDVFATLRLQCNCARELWVLEAADLVLPRLGLRTDLDALHRASLLCEAVRLLAPEHAEATEVVTALGMGLDRLAAGEPDGAVAALARILRAVGLLPDLARCARCSAPRPERGSLDGDVGMLCAACAGRRPTFLLAMLSPEASSSPASRDAIVSFEDAIAGWIETQAGRPLRSHRALVNLRR